MPEETPEPKDFATALEEAPEEVAMPVEGEGSSELDAEQADIAQQLGIDGKLLKQFIESVMG